MSSRRRYVDVSDILDAVEDENDSDACDLLGESDSDDDDYAIPVSLPEDDTGTENESDWDEEDDFSLQQLESTQPAKKQKKDKPTINYKWRKKLYDVPNSTFTGNVLEAPKNPLTRLDYFYQFIDNDMFQILAENTNLYAVQKHGKSLDTNLKELEQIVGMFFVWSL